MAPEQVLSLQTSQRLCELAAVLSCQKGIADSQPGAASVIAAVSTTLSGFRV